MENTSKPVGVLLTDLGDEEGSHAGAGAASERMGQLKSLKAIARLGLLANDVQNRIDKLST